MRVNRSFSDVFPLKNGLKQGDALSPLLLNFSLQCAIRRVQVNQDGLKLNDTYQLLVYTYDVNIFGGGVRIIKKIIEPLVIASKEIWLEVNADKTKYMVIFRDQNAGWRHSMKIDSKSLEKVEEFRYLDITLTNQNSIREEIKSTLKPGNACYHSVENLLSSTLP